MSDPLKDWESIPQDGAGDPLSEWDSIKVKPKGSGDKPSALGTPAQNFAAGMGQGATQIAQGAKQLLDIPAKWLEKRFPGISNWAVEQGFPSAVESANMTQANVNEQKQLGAELSGSPAGIAGNVAGQIAATLIPAGAVAKGAGLIGDAQLARGASAVINPQTYKAAAAAGALQGALQPTAAGESSALNTGLGAASGVAGNAIVGAIGRVAQPVQGAASALHEKAVNVLERAGIPLDAAQKTGSVVLNKLKSGFRDNPFTAGTQAEHYAGQKALYNRAVLNTIGEDATAATSDVMGRAQTRINNVFKEVLDRNNVEVTDTVLRRLGQVQESAATAEKGPVVKLANRFIDSVDADGKVTGQAAYDIKKELDRLANTSDSTLKYHALQLKSTIMDAIDSSLDGVDKKAFTAARGQFSNMKKIEDAISKDGTGDISAARLANVMSQKRNRSASVYGRGPQELVDLAQAGNLLLVDKTPNSGTPARVLTQALIPGIAATAEGMRSGDNEKALTAAAAVAVLPRIAQAALNNPAVTNYMAQGMRGALTPVRDLLLLPQNSQLAGGIAQRAAAFSTLPAISNFAGVQQQ